MYKNKRIPLFVEKERGMFSFNSEWYCSPEYLFVITVRPTWTGVIEHLHAAYGEVLKKLFERILVSRRRGLDIIPMGLVSCVLSS